MSNLRRNIHDERPSAPSGHVEILIEHSSQSQMPDSPEINVVQQVETTTTTMEDNENEVVLVQTTNQFHTYRKVMVTPNQEGSVDIVTATIPSDPPNDKPAWRTSSNSSTVREGADEYQKLNSMTLNRYYGDATPYGTVARVQKTEQTEEMAVSDQSFATYPRKSPQNINERVHQGPRRAGTTSNISVQSSGGQTCTLRRGKHGFYTTVALPKPDFLSLCYADFLPKKIKGRRGLGLNLSKSYEKFQDCVDKANGFLEQNPNISLKSCEGLIQRLDHDHRANSESTTSHDRSHVIGVRLWYTIKGKKKINEATATDIPTQSEHENQESASETTRLIQNQTKICYMNIIPDFKNKKYSDAPKRKIDHPKFEDMRETVQKFNRMTAENPIPGRLLKVETLPINYAIALNEEGNLDPDVGYWCLDSQGHWNVVILRVFYIEGQIMENCEIDFKDFTPTATKVTAHQPEFEGMGSLNVRASEWLSSNENRHAMTLWPQIVELPFRLRSLVSQKGKIETHFSCYEPSKNSAACNTLRILRLWYTRPRPLVLPRTTSSNQNGIGREVVCYSGVAVYTFSPCQITLSGCCGIRKPIFATTEDTVTRINAWLSNTGAEVIGVQTDNVEKWRGRQCELGRRLEERTYNRQDFSSSAALSSLDYRLTLFRLFVRCDEKGRLHTVKDEDLPGCPEPVEPCCCFVGCTVM